MERLNNAEWFSISLPVRKNISYNFYHATTDIRIHHFDIASVSDCNVGICFKNKDINLKSGEHLILPVEIILRKNEKLKMKADKTTTVTVGFGFKEIK